MTLETTTNVTVSLTNGATTNFAFNYKVLDEAHLVIQRRLLTTGLVDKTYALSEVTVTGIGDDSGGNVEILPALAAGYEIVISRNVPNKQELDIVNQGGFFPATVEKQLDLMEMQIQQIQEKADRSIGGALGEVLSELPAASARLGLFLSFDASGNPILSTGTGADAGLRTDLAASTGDTLMGRQSSLSGSSATTLRAWAEAQEIVPGDFLMDSTGGTACQDEFDAMILASATVRKPIKMNGRFLLEGPVTMRSDATITGNADFLIDHTGNALVSPPGQTVGRVTLGGDLRFFAQQTVPIGIDANQWQYCNLNGLRFMTDGAYFTQAIKFSNVSYWSNVRDCELEGVINGIDLSDANNLGLENVNMVKYGDIGQKTFLTVSGPVSMVTGRKLSVEGVFKNTTAVLFGANGSAAASQYGFDLEFIRMEGRSGSTNSSAIDFNGAILNRVGLPLAATNWGAAAGTIVNAEGNRIDWDIANGVGIHQMGHGYGQLPERSTSLSGAPNGALARDTSDGLLKFIFGGAVKEIVLSPLTKSLPCNGFSLTGVNGVFGTDGNQLLAATRGAAIAPATGGATIDAQARTAINALISEMVRQGLISA